MAIERAKFCEVRERECRKKKEPIVRFVVCSPRAPKRRADLGGSGFLAFSGLKTLNPPDPETIISQSWTGDISSPPFHPRRPRILSCPTPKIPGHVTRAPYNPRALPRAAITIATTTTITTDPTRIVKGGRPSCSAGWSPPCRTRRATRTLD